MVPVRSSFDGVVGLRPKRRVHGVMQRWCTPLVERGDGVTNRGGKLGAVKRHATESLGAQRLECGVGSGVEGGIKGAQARLRQVAHLMRLRRLTPRQSGQVVRIGHRHLHERAPREELAHCLAWPVEGVALRLEPRVGQQRGRQRGAVSPGRMGVGLYGKGGHCRLRQQARVALEDEKVGQIGDVAGRINERLFRLREHRREAGELTDHRRHNIEYNS
mmetsp:Transcript_48592/g.96923  ORF Transcript_48592/g.96923 Transcript_48592/m.96923 type:complete len:218 (-) Transcript_48592:613-1266(-)